MSETETPVVLVVDDDPVVRTLVRRGLARFEVLEAADGEEARALLQERAVDLVVTDLLMPRLDGLGLIRWAQQAGVGSEWIILSAVDTFDAAVEAIQLGAYDFMSKPPRLEELEVSVRNALEQRRLLRERERLIAELEETTRGLAEKVRELEEKSEALRRDLERAEVIQRALLPKEPPPLDGWNVNALYRPGLHVGGDLYQVARVGDEHLAICVADATGHGVTSAMMSVLFHRRFRLADASGRPLGPATALERVNEALCEDRPGAGVFLTAAVALVHLDRQELAFAAAGHPPALLFSPGDGVRRLERTGPALGLVSSAQYGETRTRMGPGDRLLLFTDGLLHDGSAEAPWERLAELLRQDHADGAALLRALVEGGAEGDGTRTREDRDDVTALLLEAAPGRSRFDNRPGRRADRMPPGPAARRVIWYGESPERSYLEVRGRGTWTEADAFHDTALGVLETGRPLSVVLLECEHLDSTFLGTLHELTSEAGEGGGPSVEVAGASDAVRREFEELGMERVLRAVGPPPPAQPEMRPLAGATEGRSSRLRVLRAHEALASLSARNRQKFLTVVEALRSQMEE